MIFSSFWYRSGILGFLHVKFIADFRTMVMACSGCQFSLCRWFTYRTIILHTPDVLILPSPSHCLDCHCLIPLLLTLCPCCILSPPTYGPGSHPSGEERPSSWSLLQLWQTRPHCEGLPRTTHPECPEC